MATRTIEKTVTTCDAYIERTRGIKRYRLLIMEILSDGTGANILRDEADLCTAGLKRAMYLMKKAISPVGRRAKANAEAVTDLEGQEIMALGGQTG